jgi:hypothetical protein
VEVHRRVLAAQQPVLEPVGLAHAQYVAKRLELRNVRVLVCRVGDDDFAVRRRWLAHRRREDFFFVH